MGGRGKGKSFGPWTGPTLGSRARKDVRVDGDALGFSLQFPEGGGSPRVAEVEPSAATDNSAHVGDQLLRVNGLDVAILTEPQVREMLAERPLLLRFGEA